MKFEFDNSSMPFNPKRMIYFFVVCAFLNLSFFLYLSVRDYRDYIPHEIEVQYYKHKMKSVERNTDNGILRTSPKTTFIIKPKSYLQYFILEFNPSNKRDLRLFFSINLFIITSIIAIGSRKSSNKRIFTKELLSSLKFLSVYIYIILNIKIALSFYNRSYIWKLSNNEASVPYNISSDIFLYLLVSLCAFIIQYVKKGVELQQEKDLTI